MFDVLIASVSLENILALPKIVLVPSGLIVGLLLLRALTAMLQFHPIKFLSNLIFAFLITVLLSAFSPVIVALHDAFAPEQTDTTQSQP